MPQPVVNDEDEQKGATSSRRWGARGRRGSRRTRHVGGCPRCSSPGFLTLRTWPEVIGKIAQVEPNWGSCCRSSPGSPAAPR